MPSQKKSTTPNATSTAIEANLKTYPVSWLVESRKEGKINTDIAIQRHVVWNHLLQSNLIAAILNNVPIANLWLEKESSRTFNVIDGKQRTLTLCSYVSDGFPLSSKMRYKTFVTVDEKGKPLTVDLVGKKFSDLLADLKERILNYQLSFSVIDKMSADDRALVFYMGNQGMPLNDIHLLPSVLGEEIMGHFRELCKHNFIIQKVKPTDAAMKRRDMLKMLIHYLIIETGADSGLSGKEILAFCDEIRAGAITPNYDEIKNILDYLNKAYPKKRAYFKAMHLPTIMHIAKKAMDKKMKAAAFAEKMDTFFTEVKAGKHEDFQSASLQGSTKKLNVQARVNSMLEILKK